MEVLVAAHNLMKSFTTAGVAVDVLRGIDLEVRRGEFVALMGPSGCGKSTLLNILGLAERATSGDVILRGTSTRQAPESVLQSLRRAKLGYVFQHFNLLSTLSVRENVMVPLILNGMEVDAAEQEAHEVLTRVGLVHRTDAMPYSLSGGEMQRVAIARAVVHKPLVILADEPTGSLDSQTGTGVLELLHEQTTRGISLLMATHSESALTWCSRVVRMKDGALEA
jgi:putative ABC transport system ATP-binding protein